MAPRSAITRAGSIVGFLAAAAILLPTPAGANLPGTDGGPADRGCKPVLHKAYYVGATKMACSNARVVAKKGIHGHEKQGWRCTGLGTGFGHCHGTRGRIAHWAVND